MKRALVTVGQQLPFDRLVKLADQCAADSTDWGWFAQIGIGGAPPNLMASAETLAARDFEAMMAQADLIIGHAGIGTILGALELGKPVAIMAREAQYGEHRNDHQLATLERFTNVPGVTAISSADDLTACIKALEDGNGQVETPARLPEAADPGLLQMVAEFVDAPGQKP